MSEYPYENNTSGMGKDSTIPDGIKGWSWGGFGLNWLWAIFNNTWLGLLVFVPYVGFIMTIVLGIKGREWAWRNKQWQSVAHFNHVQRIWSIATLWFYLLALVGTLLVIALMVISDVSFVTR